MLDAELWVLLLEVAANRIRCTLLEFTRPATARTVEIIRIGYDNAEIDICKRIERVTMRDAAVDVCTSAELALERRCDVIAAAPRFVELIVGDLNPSTRLVERTFDSGCHGMGFQQRHDRLLLPCRHWGLAGECGVLTCATRSHCA
ncbi:hypothetical protein ASD19_09725 [Microbacterium sp. Root53]|nr:hypothetical protein ASD19_09725 [Microbacterium sp. Root53]